MRLSKRLKTLVDALNFFFVPVALFVLAISGTCGLKLEDLQLVSLQMYNFLLNALDIYIH